MLLSRAVLVILALGGALAKEPGSCDAPSGVCEGDSPSMLQLAKQHGSDIFCMAPTICMCNLTGDVCYQDGHVGCKSNIEDYDPSKFFKSCYDSGECECKPLPATDIRPQTPSCSQYQSEWCWATAISEVAAFYDPNYKVTEITHPEQTDCHCIECYVVGLVKSRQCCPPSPGRESCKNITGHFYDVVEGIKMTVGVEFTYPGTSGIFSQQDLDRVIAKKQPMILDITWCSEAKYTHYLTVAGSDGNGTYYVHDPLNLQRAGVTPPYYYQELRYDQILHYVQPWQGGSTGRWTGVIHVSDPSLSDIRAIRPSQC